MSETNNHPQPTPPRPRTAAQQEASRRNGARSRGPRTPEGKARSSRNAITHTLTAEKALDFLLQDENRESYLDTLRAYREEYDPQGQTENDLVEEIVNARWFLRRSWTFQANVIDVTADQNQDQAEEWYDPEHVGRRMGLAFIKCAQESPSLPLLNRYSARHARDYHRALDKLRELQKERMQNEPGDDDDFEPLAPEPSEPGNEGLRNEPGDGLTNAESIHPEPPQPGPEPAPLASEPAPAASAPAACPAAPTPAALPPCSGLVPSLPALLLPPPAPSGPPPAAITGESL